MRKTTIAFFGATLSAMALAAVASAAATTGTFYEQQTTTSPDQSICTGLSGTTTNTATVVGHYVNTGGTFHFEGTLTQDYRSDWSDGTYTISNTPDHMSFNTNGGDSVHTESQMDQGTLYAADGSVIGTVTVKTLTHITLHGGSVVSMVSDFRVTCP
jgi:hypothetical protein